MQFGVFLLLQSPDVQPSPTIYDNAIKQAELAQIDASNIKMHGILKVSGMIKIINLNKFYF